MEIFELRYFLAVARIENVNRAAEAIHVSAGSLSKAIARLEDELQTPLFFREGRGIRLTPEGMRLKTRASTLLEMEEDIRTELAGASAGALNIHVVSEEVLQTAFAPRLARVAGKLFPQARLHFAVAAEEDALERVRQGDAQLALITSDPPKDLASQTLFKVEFRTCASREHPLLKGASPTKIFPVEQVLEHGFVTPGAPILGRIARASSTDGWRDDKFPRRLQYRAGGLKLMEDLIRGGFALGYLPDYFVESAGLVPLKISGCPYTCQQTVRLTARDPRELGWLTKLWDALG